MKKNKLKHIALSAVVGLSITGISLTAPASVAFADNGNDKTINSDVPSQIPDFTIAEIIFSPETASPGDTVSVKALTNGSTRNIFSVMAEISVNDQQTENVYLMHGENDVLEGSFTVGDSWSNGSHTATAVHVTDSDQTEKAYDVSLTSIGSFNVTNSKEDYKAPAVNSITYDKSELRTGEAITITADVTHISDIEELIVTFADEGNQSQSVNFENGNTVITKDLSEWDEGTYRVTSVFVRDKAGHRVYYEENENLDRVEVSEFTISNAFPDTQGPLVSSVTFDTDTAVPGDTVTICATAHDSTGVSYIVAEIENPVGKTSSYYLFDNGEGVFTSPIVINNGFANGEHHVVHITGIDYLGNESEFVPGDDTGELTVGSFTVKDSYQDFEAPVIKRVEIQDLHLKPGDTSRIIFSLRDKSDIWDPIVYIYRKDSNEPFINFPADLQEDGSYSCSFTVTNQWYNDEYDIRIYSMDSLGNKSNELIGIRLDVSDSPEDHFAPTVNSVTADRTDLKPGDLMTVIADVTDESNINYVLGGLIYNGERMVDEEGYEELFSFKRNANGLFQCFFKITDAWLNGEYELLLNTNDEWKNHEDDIDTNIFFTVSDSTEHRDGHRIKSIMFDKTDCVPGDTFTLTAVAKDDVDEIKSLVINLQSIDEPPGEDYNPHLHLTLFPDANGTFSATGTVDNTWINDTYEVGGVTVKDYLGNEEYFSSQILTELYINKEFECNFLTVSGSENEPSHLHVSEIKFDKEEVNIGDTIKITAKTTGEGKARELVLEISDNSFDRIKWDKTIHLTADEDGNLTGELRIDPTDPYWQKDLSYRVISALLQDTENNSRYYATGFDAGFVEDFRDTDLNTFTVDTYAEPDILPADYSEVDDAIESIPGDLSIYDREVVNTLNEAVSAVERDKTELEQVIVDGYAAAIRSALEKLVAKPADYSKVDAALAAVPKDLSIYTKKSVTTLNEAVAAVKRDLPVSEQAAVDGFAESINDAVTQLVLKNADYSEVDAAKARVPEDLSIYTKNSVSALEEALSAVVMNKPVTEQGTVDGYATAINTAIQNLKLKAADYSKVDAALSKVPEDLSHYNNESVALLNAALNAVVTGLDKTMQDQVDKYAADIEAALRGLKYNDADYTEVDKALKSVPEDLSIFTDKSVEVLKKVMEKIERGLGVNEQERVDLFASEIEAAVNNLVKKEKSSGSENDPTPDPAPKPVPGPEPDPDPVPDPEPEPAPDSESEQKKESGTTPVSSAAVVAPAKETPKTGDNNKAATLVAISGASLAGIGAAAVAIRRRKRKQ